MLDKVLPKKISREDLGFYDSLGDLAQQILAYQHHPKAQPGEFRIRLPGMQTIFAARRELLGHLGKVRGVAGSQYLVEVLRQALARVPGDEE